MNDNTFKTIIIVCLVAIVAILGVSAYFFINNNNSASAANNTLSSNQTPQNTSNVTSENTTTTKSASKSTEKSKTNDKPAVISASKAMSIVTKSFSGYDCYGGGAELFMSNGKPVYSVSLYNRQDDSSAGTVLVDARTGKILS